MSARWHQYSYSAQREKRRSMLLVLLIILVIGIAFSFISLYVLSMYQLESDLMEPTLKRNDRIISTPLYKTTNFSSSAKKSFLNPSRGDLVVISPAYFQDNSIVLHFVDNLIAFLTLQRLHPFQSDNSRSEQPVIRRLLGFPGDSLYIENFIVHIKPAGSAHFLTEFELSEHNYDIQTKQLPPFWNSELPFSGNFSEIILSDSEYFVLNDNRLYVGDSRIWNTIPANRISSKVLFRYWPFSSFGTP